MAVKKVTIIAIQEKYLDTITKQVKEIIGDNVIIQSVTVKDLQCHTVSDGAIVVISNSQIKGLVTQLIPRDCPIIIAKRDINYTNSKELVSLPPGQEILVVNDNVSNANETVESLRETVFEHNYHAYIPEDSIPETIDYIVTPGERHLLPQGLSNVIDIGSRLLDISTFEEIINLLEMDYSKSQIIRRYFKACVSLSGNDNYDSHAKDIRHIAQYHFKDIISESQSMKEAVELAKQYSLAHDARYIHIGGEQGTGKNMFAQAIHNFSRKSDQPFVSVNCASKDSDEIELILFGAANQDDVFQLAGNGTVCIEEVEELPLDIQGRLFQLFNAKDFSQIVITTSTQNCQELVEKDLFNRDLFNLFNKNALNVPALSERMEDLLPLINNIKQRIKRNDITFTSKVIEFFKDYSWAGNVKELYNVITYLSLLEEDPIGMEFLPFHLRARADEQKFKNIEVNKSIISKIEKRGFLDESIKILSAFYEGKKEYISYGRNALKKQLEEKGLTLTEQQLRMRLEVLQELGLTIVRQGRAGSTISRKGEAFIEDYFTSIINK
ncbi:Fis family transcriptional regulator [Virgibacillus phasianinus]|uniref:Fis family transcriptional regulator n=1 Tax=Virgibacillus phasianinus TaxID=2017483 RepID=A0A220U3M3_9BACI|nr:sigma 54-interacting transcriptional regulator [Virgibacillus phasianinus]ASK62516.1 Fis family transcriptional regulator [Virgibacillus phasianinus]